MLAGVEYEENKKEIYSTSPVDMEMYQQEIRYVPGKSNPLQSQSGESNLPTELVSAATSTVTDVQENEMVPSEVPSGEEQK